MERDVFKRMIGKGNPTLTRTWFYTQSRKLATPIRPKEVIAEAVKRENSRPYVLPGRMYMFHYRAKNRDILPYYDRFPLVFPFSIREDGFTGINMHYLPPVYRALLMDNLLPYLVKGTPDEKPDETYLQISYRLLNKASELRYFKPAVKSYLNSHVISRFMLVPPEEWSLTLMLPLEGFTNKKLKRVFKDSRAAINK